MSGTWRRNGNDSSEKERDRISNEERAGDERADHKILYDDDDDIYSFKYFISPLFFYS